MRGVAGQIIHAHRNHPHSAGQQLCRARAFIAVGGEPVHAAVITLGQPFLQAIFCLGQIDIGNAHLLKAQFAAPEFDVVGKLMEIE